MWSGNTGCRGGDDIWLRRPSLEDTTRLPIFVGVKASTFAPQIKADTAMVLHNGILIFFRCYDIDNNLLITSSLSQSSNHEGKVWCLGYLFPRTAEAHRRFSTTSWCAEQYSDGCPSPVFDRTNRRAQTMCVTSFCPIGRPYYPHRAFAPFFRDLLSQHMMCITEKLKNERV